MGKSNDFIGAFRHRVKAIFTHGVKEVLMNFDAISKNVKILQIGPVEPKL